MNIAKHKTLLYDQQPKTKGKYKNDIVQTAIKRLSYVKDLKFTNIREYTCWSQNIPSTSLRKLFKFCKSFKTTFQIPSKLVNPLKASRITNLSFTYPSGGCLNLLKRSGKKNPLNKLTVNFNDNYTPRQLSKMLAIFRRKPKISYVKLEFPKKTLNIPTQKEITGISRGFGKVQDLQSLKFETSYFAKAYLVKTIFKPLLSWNITDLNIVVDLRLIPEENLALALSNLTSIKSLRSFGMEWGQLREDSLEVSHMPEVVKSFQVFLKNQFKLNSFSFRHRALEGICSLASVYKEISKLKFLESLSLMPYSGDWTEKDTDAFLSSLAGHNKLRKLEIVFSELPASHVEQFYKKLSAGLLAIKKAETVRIIGLKMSGFPVHDPVGMIGVFKSLRELEFSLLLQQNNIGNAASFVKLISNCTHLEKILLSINHGIVINEQPLATILAGIGTLEGLTAVDLTFGRIKREGPKNIFLPLLEKPEKLWSLRLKFIESYFNDDEATALSEALLKKKRLRSVMITGTFPSITRETKERFVTSLRTHGIKTPPLL